MLNTQVEALACSPMVAITGAGLSPLITEPVEERGEPQGQFALNTGWQVAPFRARGVADMRLMDLRHAVHSERADLYDAARRQGVEVRGEGADRFGPVTREYRFDHRSRQPRADRIGHAFDRHDVIEKSILVAQQHAAPIGEPRQPVAILA